MKNLVLILAGAAMALTGTTATARETAAERGEAKLASILEGRVAGEPVKCISAIQSTRIQVIEHIGLVYDAGDTIYVARAIDPGTLDRWEVPVIDRFGSRLCSNDSIRTVDRTAGYITGPLFIEDFVPYTKRG